MIANLTTIIMKKISFSIAAIALAAMTFATSCVVDKDNEEDEIKSDTDFLYVSASRSESRHSALDADKNWKVGTNVFAVLTSASESSEVTGITGKLSDIFKESYTRTTVYGYENDDFISITFNDKPKAKTNGADPASFKTTMGGNVPDLLAQYLETGTFDEETMTNKFNIDALVIYKNVKDADASSPNFWYSYECTVNPKLFTVKSVKYCQGTFTARMRNKAGDTFLFTEGAWSCLSF